MVSDAAMVSCIPPRPAIASAVVPENLESWLPIYSPKFNLF